MSENQYEGPEGERASTVGDQRSPLRQAKDLAGDLKNQAAGVAQDVTREVKEQASQLTERAKEAAAGATEKLRNTAEDQKNAGADFVSALAGAVRRAAGEFDDQIPLAGDYIRSAAEQIDGASDALRQRNLDDLINGVQDFARRQPTAFLGMSVLAGFAAVRFLKSSTSSSGRNQSSDAETSSHQPGLAGSENARRLRGAGGGMQQEQRT